MAYCQECGEKLVDKFLENEGMIPYCEKCEAYRFPMFNTAISAVVHSVKGDKILLIQQYGRKYNILVAGYVNKGESAEHAVIREIKEELGLDVLHMEFNASEYYEESNTLMLNFACQVASDELDHTNDEIDYAAWYSPDEAKKQIKKDSLAEKFLCTWLEKNK